MNAGRLVVWLGMNNEPLMKGFAGATRAHHFYVAQATRTASASGKGSLKLLELSRAAEDAAVSFSLGGLQGAIRGAGNNITAFLTMVSPMAGAIGGVALAITSLLIPAFTRQKQETDDAGKALDTYKEKLDALIESRGAEREFRGGLSKARSSDATRDMVRDLGAQRSKLTAELGDLQGELQAKAAGARVFMPTLGIDPATGKPSAINQQDLKSLGQMEGPGAARAAEIAELQERINVKLRERDTIQSRGLRAQRQLNEQLYQEDEQRGRIRAHEVLQRNLEQDIIRGMGKSALEVERENAAKAEGSRLALDMAKDLQERTSPQAAAYRELTQRVGTQLEDVTSFQQVNALNPMQAEVLRAQILKAGGHDLQKLVDPRGAERREIGERFRGAMSTISEMQRLGAVDPAKAAALQAEAATTARRETAQLEAKDRETRVPESLRRGSQEAFNAIAAARANPNAKLETTAREQLQEQRTLNRNFADWQRRLAATRTEDEVLPP